MMNPHEPVTSLQVARRIRDIVAFLVAVSLCFMFFLLWISPANKFRNPSLAVYLGIPIGACVPVLTGAAWNLQGLRWRRSRPVIAWGIALLISAVITAAIVLIAYIVAWNWFGGWM